MRVSHGCFRTNEFLKNFFLGGGGVGGPQGATYPPPPPFPVYRQNVVYLPSTHLFTPLCDSRVTLIIINWVSFCPVFRCNLYSGPYRRLRLNVYQTISIGLTTIHVTWAHLYALLFHEKKHILILLLPSFKLKLLLCYSPSARGTVNTIAYCL